MYLNLNCSMQSEVFFEDLKIQMYDKVNRLSKENSFLMRFTGLPIALCSTALTLAQLIASVAEPLFKGVVNIIGSPFTEKCSALKGLGMLILKAPSQMLQLSISPLYFIFSIPITTVGMLVAPEKYSEFRKITHEEIKNWVESCIKLSSS